LHVVLGLADPAVNLRLELGGRLQPSLGRHADALQNRGTVVGCGRGSVAIKMLLSKARPRIYGVTEIGFGLLRREVALRESIDKFDRLLEAVDAPSSRNP
jgi:hypothetical protein